MIRCTLLLREWRQMCSQGITNCDDSLDSCSIFLEVLKWLSPVWSWASQWFCGGGGQWLWTLLHRKEKVQYWETVTFSQHRAVKRNQDWLFCLILYPGNFAKLYFVNIPAMSQQKKFRWDTKKKLFYLTLIT